MHHWTPPFKGWGKGVMHINLNGPTTVPDLRGCIALLTSALSTAYVLSCISSIGQYCEQRYET